jgi:hypothetical protein
MHTFEELCAEESEPVVVADNNGLICQVNRCFEETFKWKKGELKGQLLTIIMPAKFRDSHSMGISRFLSTETRSLPEHELSPRGRLWRRYRVDVKAYYCCRKTGWIVGLRRYDCSFNRRLKPLTSNGRLSTASYT